MEEVEEANKAAVESCYKVLSVLSHHHQHKDHHQVVVHQRNLAVETSEAVYRFKRVVSLLSSSLGHGKVRKLRNLKPSLPESIFLDSPIYTPIFSPKPLQIIPADFFTTPDAKNPVQVDVKSPLQLAQPTPPPPQNFQFLQHQRLQFQQQQQQQQQKFQADMMYSGRGNSSAINLKFDGASCTPTMSSNKSLISSLSMDCSVANFDSFHLIGVPQSSNQIPYQSRRRCGGGRGEDGSIKCGSSSGKCHCSKRRSD